MNPPNWSGIELLPTIYEAELELIKPPLKRLVLQKEVNLSDSLSLTSRDFTLIFSALFLKCGFI